MVKLFRPNRFHTAESSARGLLCTSQRRPPKFTMDIHDFRDYISPDSYAPGYLRARTYEELHGEVKRRYRVKTDGSGYDW